MDKKSLILVFVLFTLIVVGMFIFAAIDAKSANNSASAYQANGDIEYKLLPTINF